MGLASLLSTLGITIYDAGVPIQERESSGDIPSS